MQTKQTESRHSAGVDFSFRPEYWGVDGLLTAPWANIKGAIRKRYIQQLVAEGRMTSLTPEDLAESLTPEHRKAVGLVHPNLMGGEYLPDLFPGEVEIARIDMASVLRDVTSIRAVPVGSRIYYRVVDEYEVERGGPYGQPFYSSRKPLTLRKVINLFDHSTDPGNYKGLVTGFLDFSVVECGGDPHEYRSFLDVRSDFYPALGRYYGWRIERWYRRVTTNQDV